MGVQINMKKRERSIETSTNCRKISKREYLGILVYNIPESIPLETLKKILPQQYFIPKYCKKHLRIAFYNCSNKKERKQVLDFIREITSKKENDSTKKNLTECLKYCDIHEKNKNVEDIIPSFQEIAKNIEEINISQSEENKIEYEEKKKCEEKKARKEKNNLKEKKNCKEKNREEKRKCREEEKKKFEEEKT